MKTLDMENVEVNIMNCLEEPDVADTGSQKQVFGLRGGHHLDNSFVITLHVNGGMPPMFIP